MPEGGATAKVNFTNQQKSELQLRAEAIKRRFSEDARRPIVIEFAGCPKAGKTTVVNQISTFLKRCGFRTKVVVERASICPIRDKKDAVFNVWTACRTLASLLEETQEPPAPNDPDILFLDRGIFDTACWLSMLEKLSRLTSTDREIIESFLLLSEWRKRISVVFLFTASPADSLAREHGFLPVVAEASIMNPDVLQKMYDNSLACLDRFQNMFRIIRIDTSKELNTVEKSTKFVLNNVLNVIDDHLEEEILAANHQLLETLFGSKSVLKDTEAKQVLNVFANKGIYKPRKHVEPDRDLVQALPIAVVRNKDGDILQLRRKEREHTKPLDDKIVVWAGGHVRVEDGKNGHAIYRCLIREIKEELKLSITESEVVFLGAIWDRNSTPKTAQHVALVFEWRAPSNEVSIALSNSEFFERRGTALSGKFVASKDFPDLTELEPWSEKIMRGLVPDVLPRGQQSLL